MRVLHLASVSRAGDNLGVLQQMEWEQQAARAAGLDWDVELWTIDEEQAGTVQRQIPKHLRSYIGRRYALHKRFRAAVQEYDKIILRHAPLDPFSLFITRRMNPKLSFVIHTKTKDYLLFRFGAFGRVMAWLDKYFTLQALGSAGGLIGVTDELLEYEQRRLGRRFANTAVYPNGVFLTDWHLPIEDCRAGALKIIFVASTFFEWNGLELLLNGMVRGNVQVLWELHLVGRLTERQQRLIDDHEFCNQIIVHGVLSNTEVMSLLSTMDLSLGAFALELVGLESACTLKVRESLGAGIPVYSGHRDAGVSGLPNCYIEGSANWDTILTCAVNARVVDKGEIRRLARHVIDKTFLLRDLARSLES